MKQDRGAQNMGSYQLHGGFCCLPLLFHSQVEGMSMQRLGRVLPRLRMPKIRWQRRSGILQPSDAKFCRQTSGLPPQMKATCHIQFTAIVPALGSLLISPPQSVLQTARGRKPNSDLVTSQDAVTISNGKVGS